MRTLLADRLAILGAYRLKLPRVWLPHLNFRFNPTRPQTFVIVSFILFSTIPVIVTNHLPLVDYPNHLARLQIHKTLLQDSYLARFYEFHWRFTPYLGLDLLAAPFASFLPVEIAGRIVIILTFGILYSGTILLDRELNPTNWSPSIFAGIFIYNGAFNWGFINYIIGIGFAIWAFWIWVRYREKSDSVFIVAFTVLGMIVGVMHFYALGIYAVCVAGYECSVLWEKLTSERRLRISFCRIPLQAAISIIVAVLMMLTPVSSGHGPLVWGRSWGPQTFWDSVVKWKGQALISPIYFDHFMEKPLLLAVVAILVWALTTRTLVVNTRMAIPLAAFGMIFVAMPSELWGASFADYRLPSGVVFIALASLGWGDTSRVRIDAACLLLSLCLIVRVGSVILTWQPAQSIIEEYDTALQLVPPGTRLFCMMDGSAWGYPPLVHVPVLAAAKRGVFEPNTFTDHGQGLQLLKKRDPIPTSIRDFDYLLEIGDPEVKIPTGISLKEVGRGQTFILYPHRSTYCQVAIFFKNCFKTFLRIISERRWVLREAHRGVAGASTI